MMLLKLDFTLPLRNPVIIFSLVLFIILFAPLILNKFRIPHIIGLILAGVIIGPNGFNLLLRDSSIVLFGTVGLLYIMFLAGLEIDIGEIKKNRGKIILFGLSTFLIPISLGILSGIYILGFGLLSSILMASMFSTHTLVAYPIVSKYGLINNLAVTVTVGGTIITDTLALLVLAVVAGIARGQIDSSYWVRLSVLTVLFAVIVMFVFPLIARWFFKRFEDSVSQYTFVLALVFLAAFFAEGSGIEGIIGAFLTGLALNRLIPHASPLMNRIDFVGNALFIPFFLIGVGMLVDVKVIFSGWGALKVAAVMSFVAVVSKFLAAWITQKSFRLSAIERQMIFGLSNSHAAATLAVVLVGYNIITGTTASGEPVRLLNEDVLNGTILMILISCTISSLVVERASRRMMLSKDDSINDGVGQDNFLIALNYQENSKDLVELALMLKPRNKNPVYALHVEQEEEEDEDDAEINQDGKKLLDNAVRYAASTDNLILPIRRYDLSISNGIIYTMKEQRTTDLILGVSNVAEQKQSRLPSFVKILRRTSETVYLFKPFHPLSTLKRMVVVVPDNADLEPGFHLWCHRLINLAMESLLDMEIHTTRKIAERIDHLNQQRKNNVNIRFSEFTNWDEFLIFSRHVNADDLFVIIVSRKGHISYNPHFERLPTYLSKYFEDRSYLILYPEQLEHRFDLESANIDSTLLHPVTEGDDIFNKASKLVRRIFKK